MTLKNVLLSQMRRRALQPLWEQMFRVSVIGQNFWSSTVAHSGELHALDWLANRIEKGATVLDVGANAGQFALAAAVRLCPEKIYSFEPSCATFALLQRTIADAGLVDIIHPQPLALSEKCGHAILHSSHAGSPTASLHDLRNPIEEFRSELNEEVEVQTLDSFSESNGIVDIAFLKIDVEGHELSVLRGAQRMLAQRRIRHIQFEFGEANLDSRTYLRDFYDLLGKDFDLYRIVSDGLRALPPYHSGLEIFATMNYLAVRRS